MIGRMSDTTAFTGTAYNIMGGVLPPGGAPGLPAHTHDAQSQQIGIENLIGDESDGRSIPFISDLTWESVQQGYPLVSDLLKFHLDTADITPTELTPAVESLVREVITTRVSAAVSTKILGRVPESENFFLLAILPRCLDFTKHCSGWAQLESLCSLVNITGQDTWREEDKQGVCGSDATDKKCSIQQNGQGLWAPHDKFVARNRPEQPRKAGAARLNH